MTRYSVQPKDTAQPLFVKGYGFLSFAMFFGKSISKSLSSKYSQKLLNHDKQSATDAFKTSSKRFIQKTAEATGDLVRNKISGKITRVWKTSPENYSETNEGEWIREKYISPDLSQKISDDLRLKRKKFNDLRLKEESF